MADERLGGLSGKDIEALRAEFTEFQSDLTSAGRNIGRMLEGAAEGINNNFQKAKNGITSLSQKQAEFLATAEGQKKVEEDIRKIKEGLIQSETNLLILKRRIELATKDELKSLGKVFEHELRRKEALEGSVAAASKLKAEVDQIADAGKAFAKLASALGEIPVLGKALSGPFQKAAESARKAAEEGASPLQARMKGTGTAAKELLRLVGPSALLASLLQASKETKELSTNLGISMDSALGLQKSFGEYALQSRDARITSTALAKAQNQLQQELKLGVVFSGETLENFVKLTEYMGVSAQAAAKLSMISTSLSMSSSEFTNNLAESVTESSAALGINLPLSEAFETIGKASANTLVNLRRNPEQLGKAVAEAKRLGIEFNQLEQVSSSMLNFESSIANELEAELLTGKQLNLEQARLAALRGDTLQLTKEIASQVGTISDFENMNVIARESLAQAFGMNKDQLAEMLLRQEAMTANEQASRDLSYEQLQLARERTEEAGSLGAALLEVQQEAGLDKKFENSAKKLQDAFKQVALEVMPIVSKLADLLAGFLSSPLAKLAVGAAALASGGMMIANMMRGTMMRPMIVKDALAAGGATGNRMGMFGGVTGTTKSGKALTAAQKRMVVTKGGTRSLAAGRASRFAGSAGGGMVLGGAGMLAGGALKSAAENASSEGAALGLSAAGGALSMAGTGAMMGSMIAPGIGTAIGASIGAVVGGITSYMEKSQKMQEEAQKKRDDEFQSFVKEAMMKEAKVYMDSNQVGTSLVLGHNYQVQ